MMNFSNHSQHASEPVSSLPFKNRSLLQGVPTIIFDPIPIVEGDAPQHLENKKYLHAVCPILYLQSTRPSLQLDLSSPFDPNFTPKSMMNHKASRPCPGLIRRPSKESEKEPSGEIFSSITPLF